MMSPQIFMTYAGPVIILIFQQLHNLQSAKQAKKIDNKVGDVKNLCNGNLAEAQKTIKAQNDQIGELKLEIQRLRAVPSFTIKEINKVPPDPPTKT